MKRIKSLDGLRFIFCIVIVFSHFEFLADSYYFKDVFLAFKNPTLAVDYFFMLSGFGIFMSSSLDSSKCSIRYNFHYAIEKIKKIYPAYCISLCLGMIYFLVSIGNGSILKRLVGYIALFGVDSLLIQSIFGISDISQAINGVAWFLSSLFISYMICPFFIKYIKRIRKISSAVRGIVIVIGNILFLSYIALKIEEYANGVFDYIWYSHPIIRCWYLALGMLAAYLYKCNTIKIGNVHEMLVTVISIIYFFARKYLMISITCLRLLDVTICFFVIFVLASENGVITRILGKQLLVNLGNDSMYFYLFHYPIRIIIDYILPNDTLINAELVCIIKILIIIVGTAACTIIFKKHSTKINSIYDFLQDKIKDTFLRICRKKYGKR